MVRVLDYYPQGHGFKPHYCQAALSKTINAVCQMGAVS